MRFGAAAGFAAGLFWVAASVGVNHLFEGRSFKLFLINGGYNVGHVHGHGRRSRRAAVSEGSPD